MISERLLNPVPPLEPEETGDITPYNIKELRRLEKRELRFEDIKARRARRRIRALASLPIEQADVMFRLVGGESPAEAIAQSPFSEGEFVALAGSAQRTLKEKIPNFHIERF